MKKYLLSISIFLFSLQSFSQLLCWAPVFPEESTTSFTITEDAKGNKGLLNYNSSDVYVHIGLMTSLSNRQTGSM